MLTLVFVATTLLAADDFESLVRAYEAKKVDVNRQRGDGRKGVIDKELVPILSKIGGLKSEQAVRFLSQIVQKDLPDLAQAACLPLATTGRPEAASVLLEAADSRPPAVREAALGALREAKTPLAEAQFAQARGILLGSSPDKIKVAAARILGVQNSLAAAQALLQALAAPKLGEELALAVDSELGKLTDKAALEYLFKDGLGGSAKAPRQLVAILRAAAEKKNKDASAAAEKLLEHRSPEVAAAAVSYLSAVGFGGGKEQIISLLKKWRSDMTPAVELLSGLAESKSAGASDIIVDVSREFTGPIQIVAIGLLGRAKSEKALTRIIEAVGDKDDDVRTAAMRAIVQYQDKRIIGPLIDLMEREEGRLKGEAYKYLLKLTGQSMGYSADDWKKWWSYAERDFAFNPKEEGRTTVKAVEYYGIEIFSKQLCFVIDCSSSMLAKVNDREKKRESTRVELAKRELTKTLRGLKEGTAVNIISFNSSFHPMAKNVTPLSKASRARTIKYVEDLKTAQGTNIFDTLSAALVDKNVDTIFLLSDGQPTQGKYTDPATILREIRKINLVRNVTINTIAIGEELAFMKQLAQENGGKYVFVKD
jgi:HEAT repeat protein